MEALIQYHDQNFGNFVRKFKKSRNVALPKSRISAFFWPGTGAGQAVYKHEHLAGQGSAKMSENVEFGHQIGDISAKMVELGWYRPDWVSAFLEPETQDGKPVLKYD